MERRIYEETLAKIRNLPYLTHDPEGLDDIGERVGEAIANNLDSQERQRSSAFAEQYSWIENRRVLIIILTVLIIVATICLALAVIGFRNLGSH